MAPPATIGLMISMPVLSNRLAKLILSGDDRKLMFAGDQSLGPITIVTTAPVRSAELETDSPAGIVIVAVLTGACAISYFHAGVSA